MDDSPSPSKRKCHDSVGDSSSTSTAVPSYMHNHAMLYPSPQGVISNGDNTVPWSTLLNARAATSYGWNFSFLNQQGWPDNMNQVRYDTSSSISTEPLVSHSNDNNLKRTLCEQEKQTSNDDITLLVPVSFQALPSTYTVAGLPASSIGGQFLALELQLAEELKSINFTTPVTHIYNPLEYAIEAHGSFIKQYCTEHKEVLFLGMNPGPYGMVQTGVPFGEVNLARDWLKVTGAVNKPLNEHLKRPVQGFECKRVEISGSRFWGYFKSRCKTPEQFFKNCYVHNMCPLAFMNQNGKNLTPPDLQVDVRNQLNEICDRYLRKTIELLNVKVVVGIGVFAKKRAEKALNGMDVDVKVIMHPSPANPAANKGWDPIVEKQLDSIGVGSYLPPSIYTIVLNAEKNNPPHYSSIGEMWGTNSPGGELSQSSGRHARQKKKL